MTFIHPLLLGGLIFVGIPVLLHLTMRQKPKRLPFPAFRFLIERVRANQRSLRIRHWLLLALRMAMLALMCVALAKPRLFSEGLNLGADRPRAIVMLFDTSPSMEYTVRGKTRLDEARQRAEELIADLPPDSKVAILDSAEIGGEWSFNIDQARRRLADLKIKPASAPVTRQLDQAYRLLRDLGTEADESATLPQGFLYVFSDRTVASWDAAVADNLHPPDALVAAFVDVGANPENVNDVGIARVEPSLQVVPAGNAVEIRVTVRSVGVEGENQLTCTFDNESRGESKPITLKAGESSQVTFERLTEEESGTGKALKPGWHQVTVRLAANDALPGNNVGYATFRVQKRQPVLAIADHAEDAAAWQDYINRFVGRGDFQAFSCAVIETPRIKEVTRSQLAGYGAVCLIDVAKPGDEELELWKKLESYVQDGGSLCIVPGGWNWKVDSAQYNDDPIARNLLPGRLEDEVVVKEKKQGMWRELRPGGASKHRLLAPFMRWKKYENILFYQEEAFPWALHSWKVAPYEDKAEVIAAYEDGRPALLERVVGQGRVVMFTTAFDQRKGQGENKNRDANNYLENGDQSFFSVLVNVTMNYLVGGARPALFNYFCGDAVPIDLGPPPYFPLYSLNGPGVEGSGAVPKPDGQLRLTVTQATEPGNFSLLAGDDREKVRMIASFSLGVRPEEWDLTQTPVETIEKTMGPNAVVGIEKDIPLGETLAGKRRQPVDLLPYLMILLLIVLACENGLANRFYKKKPEEAAA